MKVVITTHARREPTFSLSDWRDIVALEAACRSVAFSSDHVVVDACPPFNFRCSLVDALRIVTTALQRRMAESGIVTIRVLDRESELYLQARLGQRDPSPEQARVGSFSVDVILGDITQVSADAIVNASNTDLHLGGGVSGAIRRAALPSLQVELSRLASATQLEEGDVVVTGAHGLPNCRWVFHAATSTGSLPSIRTAILHCMELAETRKLKTLAMPALGCGVGGCSVSDFGQILAGVLREVENLELSILVVAWSMSDQQEIVRALRTRD